MHPFTSAPARSIPFSPLTARSARAPLLSSASLKASKAESWHIANRQRVLGPPTRPFLAYRPPTTCPIGRTSCWKTSSPPEEFEEFDHPHDKPIFIVASERCGG